MVARIPKALSVSLILVCKDDTVRREDTVIPFFLKILDVVQDRPTCRLDVVHDLESHLLQELEASRFCPQALSYARYRKLERLEYDLPFPALIAVQHLYSRCRQVPGVFIGAASFLVYPLEFQV